MSTLPHGESIRRAVKWISEALKETPEKSISVLIQQVCLKFDLTPKEADFLTDFYKKNT